MLRHRAQNQPRRRARATEETRRLPAGNNATRRSEARRRIGGRVHVQNGQKRGAAGRIRWTEADATGACSAGSPPHGTRPRAGVLPPPPGHAGARSRARVGQTRSAQSLSKRSLPFCLPRRIRPGPGTQFRRLPERAPPGIGTRGRRIASVHMFGIWAFQILVRVVDALLRVPSVLCRRASTSTKPSKSASSNRLCLT